MWFITSLPLGLSKSERQLRAGNAPCCASFIRSRSGVPNSSNHNFVPDAAPDGHDATMQLWQFQHCQYEHPCPGCCRGWATSLTASRSAVIPGGPFRGSCHCERSEVLSGRSAHTSSRWLRRSAPDNKAVRDGRQNWTLPRRKAGVHFSAARAAGRWVPAFAGTAVRVRLIQRSGGRAPPPRRRPCIVPRQSLTKQERYA